MRVGILVGVLLLGFGVWAATGHATYKRSRNVLQVGDLKAEVKEENAVPAWVGYCAIGAGVLVLVASAGTRKR